MVLFCLPIDSEKETRGESWAVAMSIPIGITKTEARKLRQELSKTQDFLCLDPQTHIKALLVGQQMLMAGKAVNAKIIKGYEIRPQERGENRGR